MESVLSDGVLEYWIRGEETGLLVSKTHHSNLLLPDYSQEEIFPDFSLSQG